MQKKISYALEHSLRIMKIKMALELSTQTDGQDTELAHTLNNYTWWTDYSCSFMMVTFYIPKAIIKLCLISSAIHSI